MTAINLNDYGVKTEPRRQTFREVLWRVAREDPRFTTLQNVSESTVIALLKEGISNTEALIDDVHEWSAEYAAETARQDYNFRQEEFEMLCRFYEQSMNSYGPLLAELQSWVPATDRHIDLKVTAIAAIQADQQHDMSHAPQELSPEMTGEEYRAEVINELYDLRNWLKSQLQIETSQLKRNIKWTQQLYDDLFGDQSDNTN